MSFKHRRLCGLVLALFIAAVAAPSASAQEADQFLNSPPTHAGPSPTQVRVVEAPASSGFDWGDAGIGAGAALAVVILGGGGAVALSNRRGQERPNTA